MAGLQLETFLRAGQDPERAQYEILGGLQHVRHAFSKNIIYPHLADLIKLYEHLKTVTDQLEELRGRLPGRITGVDLEAGEVIYGNAEMPRDDIAYLEDLTHWALPMLQQAIEEGRTIFEFVDEHLHMEEVGIVPAYVHEGYLIIPDEASSAWCVLQYQLSVFTGPAERYRSLRTAHIKTIPVRPAGLEVSPQRVKLDLLTEHRDLPNPATFFVDPAIGFPYEATMLPVAKRKLMRHLMAQA
ncbi:MAG: hypothetical protein AAGI71_13705 [Bacteroidota bacterium]